MKARLLIVIGTRPNFIKVTQFRKHIDSRDDIELSIVHTGQHYDEKMSQVFFDQFSLVPNHFLDVGHGTPSEQMADIMIGLEQVINEFQPQLVMVVGDVNSTLAAAITANKMHVPIAHLESGLRSGDRSMPEEINRILTDKITDLFFVTEESGRQHLLKEGVSESKIEMVGNTMIDTVVAFDDEIDSSDILESLQLSPGSYVLMTMHRPATVDNIEGLERLLGLLEMICEDQVLVFPIHPRTVKRFEDFGMKEKLEAISGLHILKPLDYFAFQKLIKHAQLIITDSGGIQEESTFRKIPCLTLRPNTERPSTIEIGTNELVEFDLELLAEKMKEVAEEKFKKGEIPPLWDGKATERIIEILASRFSAQI